MSDIEKFLDEAVAIQAHTLIWGPELDFDRLERLVKERFTDAHVEILRDWEWTSGNRRSFLRELEHAHPNGACVLVETKGNVDDQGTVRLLRNELRVLVKQLTEPNQERFWTVLAGRVERLVTNPEVATWTHRGPVIAEFDLQHRFIRFSWL